LVTRRRLPGSSATPRLPSTGTTRARIRLSAENRHREFPGQSLPFRSAHANRSSSLEIFYGRTECGAPPDHLSLVPSCYEEREDAGDATKPALTRDGPAAASRPCALGPPELLRQHHGRRAPEKPAVTRHIKATFNGKPFCVYTSIESARTAHGFGFAFARKNLRICRRRRPQSTGSLSRLDSDKRQDTLS